MSMFIKWARTKRHGFAARYKILPFVDAAEPMPIPNLSVCYTKLQFFIEI